MSRRVPADNFPMDAVLLHALKDAPHRPRAFKRFYVDFTALVTPAQAGSVPSRFAPGKKQSGTITASIENISLNGLSFTSPMAFAPDRLLMIELPLGAQTFTVLASVRRSRITHRLCRRVCETGVQFMKSSATADFVPALAKYLTQRLMAS